MSAVTASLDRAGTAARPAVPETTSSAASPPPRIEGREARTVCWSTQPADVPVWDVVLAGRSAEAAGPLDHAIAVEAWEVIRTALAGLPDRQRVVVVLRDVEGSTSEEVRALLGLSVGNQRVLLHRGRARLRVLLGPGAVDAVGA